MASISTYAKIYTERYGFSLVQIEPKQKHTTREGWGDNTLDTPEAAVEFYEKNPNWNVAFELGKSKLCSLDIDEEESFNTILEEFGFSKDDLMQYPTIKGASKGKRIMFRVPDGANLPYTKLNWPSELDPSGEKHKKMLHEATELKKLGEIEKEEALRLEAKKYAKYTVFELRAADGKHRLDMAPPSIHPDTGKPYEWMVKPPKTLEEWPTPPDWLLAVWSNWESLSQQFKDACPWVEAPEVEQRARKTPSRHAGADDKANEVVDTFNREYPLDSMLETYGYVRKGKRYLSPHSTTKLPGVHVLTGGDKCWIFHASDPLCSEDKGQPVSSYDLFCEYEHRGDKSKAFKEAAKMLGIELKMQPNKYTPPPISDALVEVEDEHHEMMIDFDPFIFLSDEKQDKEAPLLPTEKNQIGEAARWVDDKSPLPWCTDKGKPLNHHENIEEVARRLGIIIRYNVIKKDAEIIIPRKGFSTDNQLSASVAWLKSQCSIFNMPIGNLDDYLLLIADSNQFNPVADWLNSKPWDGVSRVQEFYDTVTVAGDNTLKESLMRKWMISAITGAFSPVGVSAQGVLVMQGEQGLGKTSWFKSLVPADLGLIKDGMLLRPDNKDSVKEICSHWLIELGELDSTFKKSDIAALKSFITNDRDILRLPFGKKYSEFVRRTVFFASVNPKEFLHDSTGNRRYWTLEVTDLNSKHGLDMQQVWAEFYMLWKGGEKHYLSPSEEALLFSSNEEFSSVDPVEEKISTRLDWDSNQKFWKYRFVTDVLEDLGFAIVTKADKNTAGAALRKLNGGQTKRGASSVMFLCPPRRIQFD